jgi:hypothetical protein
MLSRALDHQEARSPSYSMSLPQIDALPGINAWIMKHDFCNVIIST